MTFSEGNSQGREQEPSELTPEAREVVLGVVETSDADPEFRAWLSASTADAEMVRDLIMNWRLCPSG